MKKLYPPPPTIFVKYTLFVILEILEKKTSFGVSKGESPLVVVLGKRGARGVKTRFIEKNGFSPLVKFPSFFKADSSQSLGKHIIIIS